MHLEEETIQRLLHRELDPPSEAPSRAHVATCPECRTRLEEAEREESTAFVLLRRLDHAPPRVTAETVMARARRRSSGWERRVAVVLLAVAAAGAAYAMPRSPLPGWVDRVVGWAGGDAPDTATAPTGSAGISVEPTGPFTIVFEAEQSRGAASVLVADASHIVVRSRDSSASFDTEEERLTIRNAGSTADFDIELPRGAPRVEILVGGRRVLLQQGSLIVTDAPIDADGRYRVPLEAPP
jgi:hypothetical protein